MICFTQSGRVQKLRIITKIVEVILGCQSWFPLSVFIYAYVLVNNMTFILALGQVVNLSSLISPEAAMWRGRLLILTVGRLRRPGSVKHRVALIRSDLRTRT